MMSLPSGDKLSKNKAILALSPQLVISLLGENHVASALRWSAADLQYALQSVDVDAVGTHAVAQVLLLPLLPLLLLLLL